MKIAITGANGLFGFGLVQMIQARHEIYPMTRATADLTDIDAVRGALTMERPDALIHTAGIPDPDLCESEPERAFNNNVLATRHVVIAARELGFSVAHISTDAVFDGSANTPRIETDAVRPVSVYGKTKLLAEEAVAGLDRHWIFRVSVLFGPARTTSSTKDSALCAREAHIPLLLTSKARPHIRWMQQARFLR